MAKTRTKKPVMELITTDQAHKEMMRYSEASSKIKGIEAEIEQQVQQIRDRYSSDIKAAHTEMAEAEQRLQYFAERNRDDYFAKKKSMDLTHGVIGFRIGTPKVKADGMTLKKALDLVKEFDLPYVRVKEDLDREKIIASRNDEQAMAKLQKCGLIVVQDETWYIEAKEEEYA